MIKNIGEFQEPYAPNNPFYPSKFEDELISNHNQYTNTPLLPLFKKTHSPFSVMHSSQTSYSYDFDKLTTSSYVQPILFFNYLSFQNKKPYHLMNLSSNFKMKITIIMLIN